MAGRATDLPDIGTTLQAKIVELTETGDIAALAKLRERIPPGLAAVARLDGIGPKRAAALFSELGVTGVDDLAAALEAGRLRGVPGFGPGTEERVAAQLARRAEEGAGDEEERVPVGRALPLAEEVAEGLRAAVPGVRVEVAGSLRRGREDAHDIDLVAAWDRPAEVQDALAALPAVQRVLSRGEAAMSVETHAGVRVELAVGPPASFGNLLQHATGSAAHNVRLRELAVRKGLSVSQHGIAGPGGEVAVHPDEESVYAALGLHPIPPELREDRGEIEAAQAGPLPVLVTRADLRGDLHVHTRWSDGTETIAAMVEAARARGYAYLAISDHSQSLAMAGGLDPDRVRRQWEEIEAEDARRDDIRVLKATEVNILADGRIDFDDELLAGFDWVTASMHSGFSQSRRPPHRPGGRRRREPLRRRHRPPHRPDAGAPRAGAHRPGPAHRRGPPGRDLPGGERPAAAPRPGRRHGGGRARRGRPPHDRLGRALRRLPRPDPLRGPGGPPRRRDPGRRGQHLGLGGAGRRPRRPPADGRRGSVSQERERRQGPLGSGDLHVGRLPRGAELLADPVGDGHGGRR